MHPWFFQLKKLSKKLAEVRFETSTLIAFAYTFCVEHYRKYWIYVMEHSGTVLKKLYSLLKDLLKLFEEWVLLCVQELSGSTVMVHLCVSCYYLCAYIYLLPWHSSITLMPPIFSIIKLTFFYFPWLIIVKTR